MAKKNGKKLYLAGPMTGIPQFNFPLFYEAAGVIRAVSQFDVLSPAEIDSKKSRLAAEMNVVGDPDLYRDMTGETWGDLLSRDVKLIADEADGVIVLPGWEQSRGARLEVFVAALSDKPVYDYELWGNEKGATLIRDKHLVTPGELAAAFDLPPKTAEEVPNKSGEVRTTSATGGEKGVKPERLDLIPPEFIEELGRVFGAGAKKYSDNNYLKGYEYRKSLGAMLRHVMRWAQGEDIDPETGCHHLAHAAWHCSTLYTFQSEGLGEDDRLFKAIEGNL